jgi:hypothetical protein
VGSHESISREEFIARFGFDPEYVKPIDIESIETWRILSASGQLCGMFQCNALPVRECPKCRNWYCAEHLEVHTTYGHIGG